MKEPAYRCHVICSTHWDREWVNTELENRFFLIECFDELIELFEKDPEAKYFHLDAQSIPIEDYVEARPENREILERYVRGGRLRIGPWYTLPEMNVTDGECTIRNLLAGHKLSKSYGRVMKCGYTPTGWGQLSQLPQIYQGFGIENAIFYRGINQELTPAEYIWEAPDGSRVVGIRPSSVYSRANLWSWVFLPVVHNKRYWEKNPPAFWPDNGQAYRLAKHGEEAFWELSPPDRYHPEEIPELMDKLIADYADITTTHIIPVFQGHDQSRPNPEVPKLIRDINERCPNVEMIYSNFEDYADEVVAAVKDRPDNVVVSGEMRCTNQSAPWNMCHLLPGITSCRAKLKIENRKNEIALIRAAEPVAVLQSLLGHPAPAGMLDLAWRKLLTNHSHDSIGGCCLDRVIGDVMFRGEESRFISEGIVRHGLPWILRRIQSPDCAPEAILLTAFNLLPTPRSQVVEVEVDIPAEQDQGAFQVVDADGNTLALQILRSRETGVPVSKWGFDYGFTVKRYTARVHFEKVPAMGYLGCEVKPCKPTENEPGLAASDRELENEFLRVQVADDGSLSVTDKAAGHTHSGLNVFEDDGDVGNAWIPKRPEQDRLFSTQGGKAVVRVIENGPVSATLEIRTNLSIPVSATPDFTGRSAERSDLEIVSEVSLTRGAKRVEIRVTLDNSMRDHRLRAVFPSGLECDHYHAAVPFDVVSRPVPKPSQPEWVEEVQPTDPNTGFASVSDGTRGLSILNRGLYEVEVKDDSQRSIALTLLRCSWQHGLWDTKRWSDDGFQNPGAHEFSYAIYPHAGTWVEGNPHQQLFDRDAPFEVALSGRNPGGDLAPAGSFIEVDNPRVLLSGIKTPEQGEGVILRLYNPSADDLETRVRRMQPLQSAQLLDMEENPIQDLDIQDGLAVIPVGHHKILTLRLRM